MTHDVPLIIRPIAAADTRELRHRVLRSGLPAETATFDCDDSMATAHFGALAGARIVGVATLAREPMSGGRGGAWRLRGMAVDPEWQRSGVGRRIVAACASHVAAHGGGRLWCNARLPAADFYRRLGFEAQGGLFDIPTAGPHLVMSMIVVP